jgi:PAS domain S-box-containing protein
MQEDIFKIILEDIQAGYWILNFPDYSTYISPGFKAMLGYKEDEIPNTVEAWRALIHKDDDEANLAYINAHLASKGTTPYSAEIRYYHKNGSTIWTVSTGRTLEWDGDGQPTRMAGSTIDITQRKQTEQHLKVIFEYSTDAHLLLGKKGIIDCNIAAAKMLGFESKEILLEMNPHPAIFSPEYQPDGRLSVEKSLEMDRLAYEKGIHRFEWMHKRVTGEEVLVEVTLNTVFINEEQVLLAVWHDITEQKLAENKLRRSEIMLNETQQLTHSGSWEQDLVTGRNYWSREACNIFGLEPQDEGPQTIEFDSMIHPEDRSCYLDAIRDALRLGKTSNLDVRIVLTNGTIKHIHAIGKPQYNELGRVVKLHGAIMDITEWKDAKEALIKAKVQAEQAAIAKSQFLSTMSHEIRTPMNAVIGFTHLLMQDPREDQKEYLKTLKFSAENLLVLINDILDFSKIEAGKIEFEEVEFSVRELISNIKQATVQKASEKNIQLKLLVDEDIPEIVTGDPVRLGQIITNLVSNAVKFTSKGRVTICTTLVSTNSSKTTINFEVKDTGIGIPKEKRESIFESFTQASSDTTRKYGGTGLGLTITRRLLELQGSEIRLKSKEGEGSVFSFDLTFGSSTKKISKSKTHNHKMYKESLKGTRVLIAEDNQINVVLAKEFFRRWEVDCDVADNGIIALQLVKTNDYDLVLMDLQMPEMDGYETTEEIRKLSGVKYKDLPIVALTASAMLNIQDRAFIVGMNDYISKPFNPDELYSKIKQYSRHFN